jgi:hypothetical protein
MAITTDENVVPYTQDDEDQLRQLLGLGPDDDMPIKATPVDAEPEKTGPEDRDLDSTDADSDKDSKDSNTPPIAAPTLKADKSAATSAPVAFGTGDALGKIPLFDSQDNITPKLATTISAPTPPTSTNGTPPIAGAAISPVQNAQQNLDTVKASPSGVSTKHGFGGGILKALDIAGSIVAPHAMALIPGTTLNHASKVTQAQGGLDQAINDQAKQVQIAKDQADIDAKKDPPEKKAELIRNPQTGVIEGMQKSDGTFLSPSHPDFPAELKKVMAADTPKVKEGETPLGDKATQTNQMLENRYQVLHPGQKLPPEYALTATSTQKDYDRVDKALEATEKAMGTKAQQDQANEFRKQTVAIQQQTAAARNQKQSVDEQVIETAAQTLAKMDPNDLSPLKDIASMRGDQRLLIYARAKQINPQFSTSEVNRKIKMMDNFTNGKDGQNLQSFGTFLQHAGEASDVVNTIRNINMPIINKPMNWLAKNAAGDTNYVRLQAALEPVKTEAENFMLNGHAMHVEDKKAIDTILSADASPAQIQAAVKQLGHTVQARYTEMDNRYAGVMKQHLPPESISDEARAGAAKIGVNIGGQPNAQTAAAPSGVPSGATGKAKGSDGQWHYHDKSGNDLGVVK